MASPRVMPLQELIERISPGHRQPPWSWDQEEADIRARLCLCCGRPGHHQQLVEQRMAKHGFTDGVCVGDDGRLHDGHHRIVAARTLGIEFVPIETRDECDARWLRDHGSYVWELRRFGDVHAGGEWEHVQNYRRAARLFARSEAAVGSHRNMAYEVIADCLREHPLWPSDKSAMSALDALYFCSDCGSTDAVGQSEGSSSGGVG